MINKLGFGFLRLPKNGEELLWRLCRRKQKTNSVNSIRTGHQQTGRCGLFTVHWRHCSKQGIKAP